MRQSIVLPALNGVLCALLLLCNSGCDREESVSYFWNETQCADPWRAQTGAPGADTGPLITAYLENRGIAVREVGFDGESPLNPWCEACTCGTERRIIVTVDESDGAAMEDLGFYR